MTVTETGEMRIVDYLQASRTLTQDEVDHRALQHDKDDLTPVERLQNTLAAHFFGEAAH